MGKLANKTNWTSSKILLRNHLSWICSANSPVIGAYYFQHMISPDICHAGFCPIFACADAFLTKGICPPDLHYMLTMSGLSGPRFRLHIKNFWWKALKAQCLKQLIMVFFNLKKKTIKGKLRQYLYFFLCVFKQ